MQSIVVGLVEEEKVLDIRLLFAYTDLDETIRERGRGAGLISVRMFQFQRFACRTIGNLRPA